MKILSVEEAKKSYSCVLDVFCKLRPVFEGRVTKIVVAHGYSGPYTIYVDGGFTEDMLKEMTNKALPYTLRNVSYFPAFYPISEMSDGEKPILSDATEVVFESWKNDDTVNLINMWGDEARIYNKENATAVIKSLTESLSNVEHVGMLLVWLKSYIDIKSSESVCDCYVCDTEIRNKQLEPEFLPIVKALDKAVQCYCMEGAVRAKDYFVALGACSEKEIRKFFLEYKVPTNARSRFFMWLDGLK